MPFTHTPRAPTSRPPAPRAAFLLALAITGAFAPAPAQAHPHVWVTAQERLVFDGAGHVTMVRHRWTFDRAFSAWATQGLDADGDGVLSAGELAGLAKENMDGLAEFGWFTRLRADGVKATFLPPQNGAMSFADGQLTLTFDLPLEKPLPPGRAMMFEVSDPTYFVAFSIAGGDDAVKLENAPQGCVVTITRPKPPQQPAGGDLSEAFFEGLGAASNYGGQFANKVVAACP
ncbi:DUF1007 family protein [Camelimonas abortus]|uniref:DUF1007 family protein n=1 Tax=Camelimonas abortus TaxID=1017184 RepID=A0ABV7LER9_9HYPH